VRRAPTVTLRPLARSHRTPPSALARTTHIPFNPRVLTPAYTHPRHARAAPRAPPGESLDERQLFKRYAKNDASGMRVTDYVAEV
jgi:hypothetical protein